MIQKIIFSLIIIVSIASCKKTDTTDPGSILSKTELNVAYGSDPLQKFDVYLPPNRNVATTRTIIMIHGGGWTSGDKSDFTVYVDTLKRRLPNYAIFNLNYRLVTATTNKFPTQELDVKSAVEYIYSKRSEYGISNQFALLGASAGAHLALLQAYKYTDPVRMKAVVDLFGPADMTAMYTNPAVPVGSLPILNLFGFSPTNDPQDLYGKSSPVNFVNTTVCPTIVLHGGADAVVSKSQSDSLVSRLAASNVEHSYVVYPTQGHGWIGDDLYDSFNRIQSFIVANMGL